MLLLAGTILSATAQTKTVTGTVIDKKTGNPLPGARVEATGGAETTETDADGTFSLEVPRYLKKMTATYPGMRDKSLKLEGKDNLLFRLKPDKNSHRFVNIDAGFELNGSAISGLCFFGQQKKNWGWFVKYGGDTCNNDIDIEDDEKIGLSLIAGVIKNISFKKTPLYAYLGAGYGNGYTDVVEEHKKLIVHGYNNNYSYEEYVEYVDRTHRYDALVVDGGIMYRWNHINLNAGLSFRGYRSGLSAISTGLHIGVGYAW